MLSVLLAFALNGSQIGDLNTHRDWIVGCDNQGVCHATSLYPEPTPDETKTGADLVADNMIGLAIHRQAGAGDDPHLRFLPCYQCDPTDDPDPMAVRSLTVRDAAGEVLLRSHLTGQDVGQANAPEGLATSVGSALIAALAKGETLALSDGAQRPLATISLRGLRDALQQMDANQFRFGTVTALVERGEAAAYFDPSRHTEAPILVPRASTLPPRTLAAADLLRLQKRHRCSFPNPGLPKASYDRLDDRSTMLLLNAACSSYNGEGYIYVVDNRGRAKLATVRLILEDAPVAAPQAVSAYWDPKTQRLHSFGRGAPMADCGQQQAFAWDGAQFLLVEEADMAGCRGSVDYITVYRRETVERK